MHPSLLQVRPERHRDADSKLADKASDALTGRPYIVRMFTGLLKPKSNRLGVDFAGTVEAVGRGVTVASSAISRTSGEIASRTLTIWALNRQSRDTRRSSIARTVRSGKGPEKNAEGDDQKATDDSSISARRVDAS